MFARGDDSLLSSPLPLDVHGNWALRPPPPSMEEEVHRAILNFWGGGASVAPHYLSLYAGASRHQWISGHHHHFHWIIGQQNDEGATYYFMAESVDAEESPREEAARATQRSR